MAPPLGARFSERKSGAWKFACTLMGFYFSGPPNFDRKFTSGSLYLSMPPVNWKLKSSICLEAMTLVIDLAFLSMMSSTFDLFPS